MYKKCYVEKVDSEFENEMEKLSVYVRKNQIKNPKVKYYKLKGKFDFQRLLIDENGMNFLIDNYPYLVDKLVEVNKNDTNSVEWWDNEKIDVMINELNYEYEYYNSKNTLINTKPIIDKLLGIDEFGNVVYWNVKKQIVVHQKQFIGGSGTMYSNNKRVKINKKGLNNFFNDFYYKWVQNVLFGRR